VVKLPQTFDYIFDTNSQPVVTRDLDPMIIVDSGKGGYVTTRRPGEYSVLEACYTITRLTKAHVPIRVDLGVETVVPNVCPSG
jgi:hypothetical protein